MKYKQSTREYKKKIMLLVVDFSHQSKLAAGAHPGTMAAGFFSVGKALGVWR
jgi:hypothetical protein